MNVAPADVSVTRMPRPESHLCLLFLREKWCFESYPGIYAANPFSKNRPTPLLNLLPADGTLEYRLSERTCPGLFAQLRTF